MAIARAVINRPELLVADEPTGNVDAEMAKRLLHLFTALNRLGTTVVVATHDVGLIAPTPGAQLIRLENGDDGRPDRIADETRRAAEPSMMLDWLFASPVRPPTARDHGHSRADPVGDRDHELFDHDHCRNRTRACEHRRLAAQAIEIPLRDRRSRPAAGKSTPLAQSLRSTPGVASAEAVPETEMRQTLQRWLGPAAQSVDLPVPALITFDVQAGTDLAAIEQRVGAVAPGAESARIAIALAPLLRSMRVMQLLALGLVAADGGAAAAAIVLAARGALDTHRSRSRSCTASARPTSS